MRLILVVILMLSALPGWAEPRQYRLDPKNSLVEFIYVLSGAAGKGTMPITRADLEIDFGALSRSQADVSLSVTGARTSAVFVTQALKSDRVLNADEHPLIRFRSRSIQGSLAKGAKISGDVTIRGVTRPLTLDARLFRARGTDPKDLSRLVVQLSGHINRSDFGAGGYGDLVQDRIDLNISAHLLETGT